MMFRVGFDWSLACITVRVSRHIHMLSLVCILNLNIFYCFDINYKCTSKRVGPQVLSTLATAFSVCMLGLHGEPFYNFTIERFHFL